MSLSLVSGKLTFLHDSYIAATENRCVSMVVKCTLFTTHVASLLLGALFNAIFVMHVISLLYIRRLIQHKVVATKLHTWALAIATSYMIKMPKMYYCGLKSSKRICKYALIASLLVFIFVKRNVHKKGGGCCAFSSTIRYR